MGQRGGRGAEVECAAVDSTANIGRGAGLGAGRWLRSRISEYCRRRGIDESRGLCTLSLGSCLAERFRF
eukprot:604175-Rhodomonas_salina.3